MDNIHARKIVAERIKEERQKRQWSQAKLAELVNVKSSSTVGNWESGAAAPDYDKLSFLADLFGVSTDYLLGRVDRPSNKSTEETMQLNADTSDIFSKYICCDEIGQGAIQNCVDYHYKRCCDNPTSEKIEELIESADPQISKLFLSTRDKDYERMKKKIPYLNALRKDAHKSYMDITQFLWDYGYGAEICLLFVMGAFGHGPVPKVPCESLYNDIEMFLKKKYIILSEDESTNLIKSFMNKKSRR